MGVLRLFRHFIQSYKDFYIPLTYPQNVPTDILLLDCNAIFHPACREIFFPESSKRLLHPPPTKPYDELEKLAFRNITRHFEYLMNLCPPKKVLYLAIDGVAGMCKQAQQRKRRYKGAKDKKSSISESHDDNVNEPFDTNNITVGTPFMKRLCRYIRFWIEKQKETNLKWKHITVIYDDMYVEGEGEHKLITYLKNPQNCNIRTSYTVYSPDADLVMLCMCLTKGNGYILRDNIYDDIKGKYLLVDCNVLKNKIGEDIKWDDPINFSRYFSTEDPVYQISLTNKATEWNLERAVRDYVLFLMCIGNDFLPNLYCLEIGNQGIETLQKCYLKTSVIENYLLDDASSIDQQSFVKLFEYLKDEEQQLIGKKYKKLKSFCKYPDPLLSDEYIHESDLSQSSQDGLVIYFDKLRQEYYNHKFGKYDENMIRQVVMEYIRGLHFVITYYVHKIPSYEWCYPYHYAPLMIDIYNIAKTFSYKEWLSIQSWNYKPALTLNQALLGVIPPSSYKVLPETLQPILLANKDHELFKEEFKIDLEGKQQDYEGVCILPTVSYQQLKRICKDTSKTNIPIVYK